MNRRKIIMVSMTIGLIILILASIGIYTKQEQKAAAVQTEQSETEDNNVVTYNGKKYKYNTDIKALLFLGIDRSEKVEVNSQPGEGGQADTILLVVLDRSEKTLKVIEVSRDTMIDISVYDASGSFLAKSKAQIALQYAYGNSTGKSSQLMKNTVSDLFYGIPVNGVITLDIEGLSKIVDAVGGVRIVVPDDYSVIDPAFTTGTEVVMDGSQAEKYIRYRDTAVTGSNDDRMRRQNQFLMALIQQLKGMDGSTLYDVVMRGAGEYIYTDVKAEELKCLSNYGYEEEMNTIPGKMQAGPDHDEFYPDESKLYEIVLKLFYKSIDK